MNTTVSTITKSIAKEFADATLQNDINAINNLLCENGEYEIQTKNLVIRRSNKRSFLKWFKNKLSSTQILKVDYDHCIHCYIGNTVLLFNNGEFPIIPKDSSHRKKMGLMLDIQSDKIKMIKFCSLFIKADNPFMFEQRIRDEMKEGDSDPLLF